MQDPIRINKSIDGIIACSRSLNSEYLSKYCKIKAQLQHQKKFMQHFMTNSGFCSDCDKELNDLIKSDTLLSNVSSLFDKSLASSGPSDEIESQKGPSTLLEVSHFMTIFESIKNPLIGRP